MPCGAVLCGAVRCCAVLCRAACFTIHTISYMPGIIRSSIPCIDTTMPGMYVQHCRIAKKALPAQPSPAIAQQRNAPQCDAVPCPTVMCRVRCAFFRAYTTRCHAKYQVPGTGMCVYSRLCAFSFDCPLSILFMPPPPKKQNHAITSVVPIRSWHRQQAYITAQGTQPCTSSSWHYQNR